MDRLALSLALKDVRLALQEAGDDRFAVVDCLADEWQRVVDQGLGEEDLTVVTRALDFTSGSDIGEAGRTSTQGSG